MKLLNSAWAGFDLASFYGLSNHQQLYMAKDI